MLDFKQYSTANKLQDAAFVQLKMPDGVTPAVTESGEKIGFELHSVQSTEFKRALRSTADLGLTKSEQDHQKKVLEWIAEGTKPSEENLDLLDQYEAKVTSRMQRVFAMVTKKIHNIELQKDYADSIGIKVTSTGKIKETPENIHLFYIAHPDLSAQIGDAITDKQNFINA